jgi:hypothetical protein
MIVMLIACTLLLVAAAFIGDPILGDFQMIKVLIVLALGVAGGLAVVWWGSHSLTGCDGIGCGVGSSVSGSPGP